MSEEQGQATPVYLGAAGQVFGWIHMPETGTARGAVVLCPPLARELTSTHFAYRRLAVELARRGIAAVRFDYRGTGDSAGEGESVPPGWAEDIEAAIEVARDTGALAIGAVGMRMGALLALLALAPPTVSPPVSSGAPLRALVAWDPCESGASFLRHQRALARLSGSPASATAGRVEVPGSVLDAEVAGAIKRIEIRRPPAPVVDRLLLLERPGHSLTAASAAALEGASAVPVDHATAAGQAELLDVEPLHQQIPEATTTEIAEWLAGVMPSESRPVRVPASCWDELCLGAGDEQITERPVHLGPAGLFGIAASPIASKGCDVPIVLFLNSGNDSHVGPSRSWVTLARRLAAAGVPSVRYDMSGLGDSPARPGEPDHVVRSPAAFADVVDAATAATELTTGDAGNVVLVGLCSGGYQALESALSLRPVGAVAVNPLLRFAPPEMRDGPIDARRRICRPVTPVVSAYRRLPLVRHLRRVGWWTINLFSGHRRPARWLSELVEGGCDVFVIGGENETRPILAGMHGRLGTLPARIEVIPGLDHALLWSERRDQVLTLVAEHVIGRFGPPQDGNKLPVAPGHEDRIAVQA